MTASPPWIFGYGSLMWNPGFPFRERRKAHLTGYRRAFCRYSFRHRGTPDRPGLVIGLLPEESPPANAAGAASGSTAGPHAPPRGCVGIALLPEPAHLAETMAYLDGREGAGYHRVLAPIALLDGRADAERKQSAAPSAPTSATAWVYVPNPGHPSYFGQKDPAQIVPLILQGRGESGTAYDYLAAMLGELHTIGVAEPELEAVLAEVERRQRETAAAGRTLTPAPGN
jgi:cation transport protein ChaC